MAGLAGGDFVLLRDGGQVLIRPFEANDRASVAELFARLSEESRTLRFHSAGARVDADAITRALAGVALVAVLGGEIVGLASYVRLRDPQQAEMAIVVDDCQHNRGIGTALFDRLSAAARSEGIQRFIALVMSVNTDMLALLGGLGFRGTRTIDGGEIECLVDLETGPGYVERADSRAHVAAAASLAPILSPRSVAVVGASRRPGSIGHELFRNLLLGGFVGPVYPVNPSARAVASVRAYPTVKAIPDQIDLAVIVVPGANVLDAARDCLEAGVRGLVVISAGFAEMGAEGRQRQDELLYLCRSHGVRLVGPNCMGVLKNSTEGALNATFAPTLPPAGNVAVASQSGALGIAILQQARQLGLGISTFVSMGNKADLSSNDLLECWEDDEATRVILLYLESFGNPRRFARVARRVGSRKPIVVVKGGRAAAGQRAAASHTAAMAGSEVAVDALFRQAGVTRCDTLEDLFAVTTLLSNQPLPAGNRVGVITNAGGLGILCADACEASGLTLPELSENTRSSLRSILPPEASVANPVDMLASGSPASYGQALKMVLDDPVIDAAIVLFIPPLVTHADDVAKELVAACTPAPSKPVLTCFVGTRGTPEALRGTIAIPSYTYPESAARALGHAARRSAWLRRPAGRIPQLAAIDAVGARALIDAALAREVTLWLRPAEVDQLLDDYGIPRPRSVLARSAGEAAAAFESLGGKPVAIKLVSDVVTHKSDVGGVRLGIDTAQGAAQAYDEIAAALRARGLDNAMNGVLVQPMVPDGVECLVGVVTDPTFGPLLAFGLGGVIAEALGDVQFRLHPLTDVDAEELVESAKVSNLLHGYRGSPPSDLGALRDLLLRLSQLVEDVPEIVELDLNPVKVLPDGQGAVVIDARIRLARPNRPQAGERPH